MLVLDGRSFVPWLKHGNRENTQNMITINYNTIVFERECVCGGGWGGADKRIQNLDQLRQFSKS